MQSVQHSSFSMLRAETFLSINYDIEKLEVAWATSRCQSIWGNEWLYCESKPLPQWMHVRITVGTLYIRSFINALEDAHYSFEMNIIMASMYTI